MVTVGWLVEEGSVGSLGGGEEGVEEGETLWW